MEVVKFSAKGCRTSNQDFIQGCTLNNEGAAVYVVADGMGGYDHGDLASKTVAEALIDYISQYNDKFAPGKLLKDAFKFANDSLYIKRLSLDYQEMGCVVVLLFLKDQKAYMAWIGDSRIYFYRDSKLAFRTKDHSLIEEISKIRSLTANDLEKYSAIVTRAIMGREEDITPELMKTNTQIGDVFLLCTDGLHKQLDVFDIAMKNSLTLETDLKEKESEMVDNYSLIRIKI